MISPKLLSHLFSNGRLIGITVIKGNAEGSHRPGAVSRHESDQQRRVDSPREKCADGNIAYHLPFNSTVQQCFQLEFIGSNSVVVCLGGTPVANDLRALLAERPLE